jgi:hypothetical protein
VRPDDPSDEDARGSLRVRSHSKKKDVVDERLDVVVRRVDVQATHRLFMEDIEGVMIDLGPLDVASDELRLSLNTKQGDALPFDVDSLGELAGRDVEIRQGSDVVLLSEMPGFDKSKKPVKTKLLLEAPGEGDPSDALSGKLQMRSKADKGQHRITIRVKKASFDGTDLHLWVEDGDGVYQDEGTFEQKGSSKGRYRRDCRKGEALPGDVFDLADLAERGLQVRDDLDEVLLEATIPAKP